ncbi:hypothetical protein pb186bvf_018483 [Paramecium bursaria]
MKVITINKQKVNKEFHQSNPINHCKEIYMLDFFLFIQQQELINDQDEKQPLSLQKHQQNDENQNIVNKPQLVYLKQCKSNIGIFQYLQYFYKRIEEIIKDKENTFLKYDQNGDQQLIKVNDIEQFEQIKKKKIIIVIQIRQKSIKNLNKPQN